MDRTARPLGVMRFALQAIVGGLAVQALISCGAAGDPSAPLLSTVQGYYGWVLANGAEAAAPLRELR